MLKLSIFPILFSFVLLAQTGDSPLLTRDLDPVTIQSLRPEVPTRKLCGPGPLKLNEECKSADEDSLIQHILGIAFKFQGGQNPKSEKVSQRDFHPKQHGCLAASFTVPPLKDSDLAVGAFSKPGTIKAVVRLSNGSPKFPDPKTGAIIRAPDTDKDARGFAMKLVGLNPELGKPIFDFGGKGGRTQDFVGIDFPSFFSRNPKNFIGTFQAILQGKLGALDNLEKSNLLGTQRNTSDVALEQYWSESPYRTGKLATKWSVKPCDDNANFKTSVPNGPDQLKLRLAERLKTQGMCFKFLIQKQVNPETEPTEDAAVEWKTPFTEVGRIDIPAQDVDNASRQSFCENLSFDPWNSLVEHMPVGGMNAIRRAVYPGISNKRRMENTKTLLEPTGDESFFDVLKAPQDQKPPSITHD